MLKSSPIRRCAACGRYAPRSEFLRIVRQHDTGEVSIGSGMGRSAYLCPTNDCIDRICKKNRLQKVLRSPVPKEICTRLLLTVHATTDTQQVSSNICQTES